MARKIVGHCLCRGVQKMINQELDRIVGGAQEQRKVRPRRSTLEARMDILAVVRDGAEAPTQIMYKANLSWINLTQHLKDLLDGGILTEHSVKNRFTYKLTEKGISILRSYSLVVEQFNFAHHDGRHPEHWDHEQHNFGVR